VKLCPVCREYAGALHRCAPEWLVVEVEAGEPLDREAARKIFARSDEEAATKWAEQSDDDGGEPAIASGDSTPIVAVWRLGSDPATATRFELSGEFVTVYNARAVPVPDAEPVEKGGRP
jgi:hypothetical protein